MKQKDGMQGPGVVTLHPAIGRKCFRYCYQCAVCWPLFSIIFQFFHCGLFFLPQSINPQAGALMCGCAQVTHSGFLSARGA